MKNNYLNLFISLIFCSCTSIVQSNLKRTPPHFQAVERTPLGQTKDEIIKLLGEPSESGTWIVLKKAYDSLEYKNSDQYNSQRATFILDPNKKIAISKTFIPTENELENSIKHLTEVTFKDLSFVNISRPHCNLHYPRSDAFLINYESGILIGYYKSSVEVTGISWMSKNDLAEMIEKMKKCEN